MFRERDPQVSLWQSEFLVPPKKARRLERSWAEVFRNEALPLIDEERFALMYCADNGRPNRAVQTVLGVHLLKEMFNLTDDEALEQLEFNLLWHHALRLDMEETHLPQKTLHNFRVRLMQHDGGRLAFQETTERIIQALGIRTGKQRLDSTHIMSNIATLTRLGLFCLAGRHADQIPSRFSSSLSAHSNIVRVAGLGFPLPKRLLRFLDNELGLGEQGP